MRCRWGSGRIGILCPAELVDEGAGLAGRCQGALFAGSIGGALRGGRQCGLPGGCAAGDDRPRTAVKALQNYGFRVRRVLDLARAGRLSSR
jgi:hypothetical protein